MVTRHKGVPMLIATFVHPGMTSMIQHVGGYEQSEHPGGKHFFSFLVGVRGTVGICWDSQPD